MKKYTRICNLSRCSILLFSAAFFILFSCEDKKGTTTTVPASLSIINVKGPTKFGCGGYLWAVKFLLPAVSPKGGWIVQQISVKRKVTKSCPDNYNAIDITFYEAWKVNGGEKTSYYVADNPDDPEVFDDLFASKPWDKTEGFEITRGKLKFFEEFKMSADWKSNNPKTMAGELPSTLTKPEGWDDKDAVTHDFSTDWKCCSDSTQNLTTDPSFPEIRGKTKTPLGGIFIGNVESVAAWTGDSVYSVNNNLLLRQNAMMAGNLTDNQIRTGVYDYLRYYTGDIDALSKLLLMLRMIYNVPDSIPIQQASSFGGWIRPLEEISGLYYKIAWPVATDPIHGPYVKYPYMGYLGATYNAKDELEYFISNFGRRQF